MSDILKEAYAEPHALSQSRHFLMLDREKLPVYYWDLYPLVSDYYHEFNPFFVHAIPSASENIFPMFRVFTVRDGCLLFADFLLKYSKEILRWKTQFLIPETYAPLIPENLRHKFYCVLRTQVNKPDIKKAKKVIIFSFLQDYYFGKYSDVEKKLEPLKDLPPGVEIEICLSQRHNPLLTGELEHYHYIHIPDLIRKAIGNRPYTLVRIKDLIERSVLRDTYLLDLMHGQLLTCDSFIHYWFLARGGMTNAIPHWDPSKKTIFDIDLSFGHKLHVTEFPNVKSQYADILYFAKTNKGELWNHSAFHNVIRKIVKD